MNTLSLTPGISVRRLDLSEYKEAASLSLEIYLQTGEEDFDEQGLETFKSFVNDEAMINSLVIYGAFDEALSRRCRVYNEQLEMVERMEAAGEITVIRPQKPVTVDRIERDIRKLTDLYEEGYACAAKYDFQ